MHRFNRNSTSFPTQITEFLKSLDFSTPERHQYSFLKYYQNIVREYFMQDIGARGLLVNHTMGLGKSIIGVAIAMDQIDAGKEVIFLMYKSLVTNIRKNIKKYIRLRTALEPAYRLGTIPESDLDRYIHKQFKFVSMNAGNMMTQIHKNAQSELAKEFSVLESQLEGVIKSGSLDGKCVIVDEAQNLFRAITNGAKNASAFYKLVMESSGLRLIFLSGTPISADPFELVACFNMLGGPTPILPESYSDFRKYFVDPTTGKLKNKEKFQNRIIGLTSYVTHSFNIARGTKGEMVQFPKDLGIRIVQIEMFPEQFTQYQFARDREIEEQKRRTKLSTPANMAKPRAAKASSYRQRSRQISNYCPPKAFLDRKFSQIDTQRIPPTDISSPKFISILENINKHRGQLGLIYSQFVGAGGLGSFARFLDTHGYGLLPMLSQYTRLIRFGDMDVPKGIESDKGEIPTAEEPVEMVEDVRDFEERIEKDEEDQKLVEGVNVEGAAVAPLYKHPNISQREVNISKHTRYQHFVSPPEPDFDAIREKFQLASGYKRILGTLSGLAMNEPVPSAATLRHKTGAIGSADTGKAVDKTVESTEEAEPEYDDIWFERYFDIPDIVGWSADIEGGAAALPGKYAFITGDIPTEIRERVIEMYNSDENLDGKLISLLLVSATGAEGIDLRGCRHVHILEPYWNWARISQVKSRAIRNDSHIHLPIDDRTVQTYVYLAVQPKDALVNEPSTDVDLWTESLANREIIDSFLVSIHEAAIECQLIDNPGYQCRSCNPDDLPLYFEDIDKDMRMPDRCTPIIKKTVQVQEVSIDGKKYYYNKDAASPYGFMLYEFLPDLNAYRGVPLDSKLYIDFEEAKV